MQARAGGTGLVLGAGGVLGAAWTIGALAALREERGLDRRDASVLVGTSAGSVLAGFLGCAIGVDVLLDHQRGIVNAEAPDISYDPDRDAGGALPPLPRPGIGSARGVISTALRPWRVTPMGALSSVLPQGRGVIGANLMDPTRCTRVLETSLRTSAAALRTRSLAPTR